MTARRPYLLPFAGALVIGGVLTPAVVQRGDIDTQVTAAIPVEGIGTSAEDPARPSEDIGPLKSGLDALAARDITTARAVRDSLPETSLDRHILAWAIALRGGGQVPSADIAAAERMLPGWPGMETLRANGERALYREAPAAQTVIDAFHGRRPQTAEGVIALARAYRAQGDAKAAISVLSPFWREEKLEAGDEAAIINEFGALIPAADHRIRMERMFYADRAASALRVASLAGAQPLADAWAAVTRGDANAGKLLKAVPAAQRGAGYLFAQAEYLRKQGKPAEAAAVMRKAPTDAASLVDADAWWAERRAL